MRVGTLEKQAIAGVFLWHAVCYLSGGETAGLRGFGEVFHAYLCDILLVIIVRSCREFKVRRLLERVRVRTARGGFC